MSAPSLVGRGEGCLLLVWGSSCAVGRVCGSFWGGVLHSFPVFGLISCPSPADAWKLLGSKSVPES